MCLIASARRTAPHSYVHGLLALFTSRQIKAELAGSESLKIKYSLVCFMKSNERVDNVNVE